MDLKQVASLLDGCQYPNVISHSQEEAIRGYGIVVAFGMSDDLLKFRGAVHGESGAYDGTTLYLTKRGALLDENLFEQRNKELIEAHEKPLIARKIEAIWTPHEKNLEPEASWLITIDAGQFETFDIMEDDELYCRGIVFYLDYNPSPEIYTLPEILKSNGVQALDEWCELNLHCRLLDLLPMVRYAIDHPEGYTDVKLSK